MQTESPTKRLQPKSRLVATEKPAGWQLHKSGFYLTYNDTNWPTHHCKYTHENDSVYPNIMSSRNTNVFEDGKSEYI